MNSDIHYLRDCLVLLREANDSATAEIGAEGREVGAEGICLASRAAFLEAASVLSGLRVVDQQLIEQIQAEMVRGIALLRRRQNSDEARRYALHCEKRLEFFRRFAIDGVDVTLQAIADDVRNC